MATTVKDMMLYTLVKKSFKDSGYMGAADISTNAKQWIRDNNTGQCMNMTGHFVGSLYLGIIVLATLQLRLLE